MKKSLVLKGAIKLGETPHVALRCPRYAIRLQTVKSNRQWSIACIFFPAIARLCGTEVSRFANSTFRAEQRKPTFLIRKIPGASRLLHLSPQLSVVGRLRLNLRRVVAVEAHEPLA